MLVAHSGHIGTCYRAEIGMFGENWGDSGQGMGNAWRDLDGGGSLGNTPGCTHTNSSFHRAGIETPFGGSL